MHLNEVSMRLCLICLRVWVTCLRVWIMCFRVWLMCNQFLRFSVSPHSNWVISLKKQSSLSQWSVFVRMAHSWHQDNSVEFVSAATRLASLLGGFRVITNITGTVLITGSYTDIQLVPLMAQRIAMSLWDWWRKQTGKGQWCNDRFQCSLQTISPHWYLCLFLFPCIYPFFPYLMGSCMTMCS